MLELSFIYILISCAIKYGYSRIMTFGEFYSIRRIKDQEAAMTWTFLEEYNL